MLETSLPFSDSASSGFPFPAEPTALCGTRAVTVPPRASIILQGIPRPEIFRVADGCIALYYLLPDGRRQILDIIGPGGHFGHSFTDCPHSGAEALTFTRLELVDMAAADIGATARAMLVRAQSHATLLGRKNAAEKVASALIDLAGQYAETAGAPTDGGATFMLHLTRIDLADWLGLTQETVSRCLNRFKRDNLIAFAHPEVVTIRDMAALRALALGKQPEPLRDRARLA